jgi:hypothetical protein
LVIGLAVAAVGMAIGRFYHDVPVIQGGLADLKIAPFQNHGSTAPSYPGVHWSVALGVASVVVVALLLFVVELIWSAVTGDRPIVLSHVAIAATWAAVVVAIIGIALPALLWFSGWVSYKVHLTAHQMAALGSMTVVITFAATLAATLWRKRQFVSKAYTEGQKVVRGVLPNSVVQLLIIWVALIVLVTAALLLACWVATSGLADSYWALAVIVPLAFFALFVDQTSMSLHPFYRKRLASAFAVRRKMQGGIPVAEPYDYQEEGTPLSAYGCKRPHFPWVTFAGVANMTGQDRSPSGRRCVSFTFGAQAVGGSQAGWVRSDLLETLAGRTIGHDLTVESAVAISGAAVASAMGAQTRFYELFLALTNFRLGAWLPNPYFVALKKANVDDWSVPGLPRIRRLDYFAREIFGIHPSTGRMLLCTDGGHLENLGLVELLRRKPSRVFCFDASGDSPPLAGTLAEAITLAREQLGIEIDLEAPLTMVPGGGVPLQPVGPLTTIDSRLSRDSVITGTIRYPAGQDGKRPPDATLIFANAVLTRDMPYELLQFVLADAGFPNDSTADQWFDVERFDAYKGLGWFLGGEAARREPAKIPARPLQAPVHREMPRSTPFRVERSEKELQ